LLSLNADHDEDLNCSDSNATLLMETNVKHESNEVQWSECSRKSIGNFLEYLNFEVLNIF
jgi:hypothetical protein